tara:strand:- start:192 stop:533 length:342 start_codon:yes stop_codon:yes gene_type:complete
MDRNKMKKLSKDNPLNEADLDGDGVVTTEELDTHERFIKIDNQNRKEDQSRFMILFSLFSVTAFIAVMLTPLISIERVQVLQPIGSTWVIANMGIIGTFLGVNGYTKIKENGK